MALTIAPLDVAPGLASGVALTASARAQVASLLAAEGTDLALRIIAEPGGCAGLRYQMYFDDESAVDDVESRFGDVRVVLDPESAAHLAGATIDFSDTDDLQGFTIDNPHSAGRCACGNSCC